MADERTEQPTPKRLKKAREEGNIPRSRDLAVAAASIAAVVAVGRLGGRLINGLVDRLATDLAHIGDSPLQPITGSDMQTVIVGSASVLALLVGPIALATMVAGVGISGLQGGWVWSPAALTINWSRLNPVTGFKRLGFMQSGLDTIKTFLMVAVIAYVGWATVDAMVQDSLRLAWVSPAEAGRRAWLYAEQLLWRISWALAVLAIGDYALQYYRVMSGLKMSKQDIRDEAKEGEGNAEVKAKVRRVQRDMSRRRMINDVAKATVVITNPTHFAVAIRYDRNTMSAPQVLAKGQDHIALKIREKARQHGVPIVENKPLAQTLFKTAEVGETIPAPLFNAVAEVLAYLIRIKQLML